MAKAKRRAVPVLRVQSLILPQKHVPIATKGSTVAVRTTTMNVFIAPQDGIKRKKNKCSVCPAFVSIFVAVVSSLAMSFTHAQEILYLLFVLTFKQLVNFKTHPANRRANNVPPTQSAKKQIQPDA